MAPDAPLVLAVAVPLAAVLVGAWVHRDARRRGFTDGAPYLAVLVGGSLFAGAVPGLVAYAVESGATGQVQQGYPTALRVVPGVVALGVYLVARRRFGADGEAA